MLFQLLVTVSIVRFYASTNFLSEARAYEEKALAAAR